MTLRVTSDSATQRRKKLRRRLKEMLCAERNHRCQRCLLVYESHVLDFHHREPAEKSFELSVHNLTDKSWRSVLHEVEKCLMVCANCHRQIHKDEHTNDNDDVDSRHRNRRATARPDQHSLFSDKGDETRCQNCRIRRCCGIPPNL